MISKTVLKYLKKTTRNVDFWGSARFCLDNSSLNFLIVPKSYWKQLLAAFNFCAHFSYAIFTFVRYVQYGHLEQHQADEKLKVFIEQVFIVHLLPTLCLHSCWFLREETVEGFFNMYLTYYNSMGK